MFNTLLKVAAVAAVGYIGFQVGRHWDEIAAEIEAADAPAMPDAPEAPMAPMASDNIVE